MLSRVRLAEVSTAILIRPTGMRACRAFRRPVSWLRNPMRTRSMSLSARSLFVGVLLGIAMPVLAIDIPNVPLFLTSPISPMNMLVMGKDHRLYDVAYNDATDLDGDGKLDIGYKPSLDYYGYFDSAKCYDYSANTFVPKYVASNKTCASHSDARWSGDFLNYLTMSRMDIVRKVLYGGYRQTDTAAARSTEGTTVLERAPVYSDGHTWGKEYTSVAVDGYNIADYTPYALPSNGKRHLFASTTFANSQKLRVLTDRDERI